MPSPLRPPPPPSPSRIEDNTHEVVPRLRGKTDPNVPPDQPIPLSGTSLSLFPQGDGAYDKLLAGTMGIAVIDSVGALAGGPRTANGARNPTIAQLLVLPDGRHVVAEMPLRMLLTIADALRAVHGDPR